ncbi:MAG: hypothetical protein GY757_11440 [bacterium]|nr:hypothetical protein [bacterium]
MKKLFLVLVVIFSCIVPLLASANTRGVESPDVKAAGFGNTPVYFIANKGQVNSEALFYARTPAFTLWITKKGLIFDCFHATDGSGEMADGKTVRDKESKSYKRDVTSLLFTGAAANPQILPLETAKHKVNYFGKGKGNSGHHTGIPVSQGVLYKDLYKNIDLKIYGLGKNIEYDWIVRPGGNPTDIKFGYGNINKTGVDKKGNLFIETGFGRLVHKRPVAYQLLAQSGQSYVEAGFERPGKTGDRDACVNSYGFEIGDYDRSIELVIDPVILNFSTYLGVESLSSPASGIAVDASGSVYVTGSVMGDDFPTEDAFQETNNGERDVFVTKFSASGSSLVYSTYLGGTADDYAQKLTVDAGGYAYVVGYTYSSDFPVDSAFQGASAGGTDAFLTKLSVSGSSLVYSTYLGGSADDRGRSIAVDIAGNAYISGDTGSANFPTANPYDNVLTGVMDVFITKFAPSGGSLVFSTYLGGAGTNRNRGLAIDSGGNVYVTGATSSSSFPTAYGFQNSIGGGIDAFVTKLSSAGNSLVYSTYLGGANNDEGKAIAVYSNGDAFVGGETYSNDFPTESAYQSNMSGDKDTFVTRFSAGGSSLVYSSFLGGTSSNESINGIAVDSSGGAIAVGFTGSSNFPTVDPHQAALSGQTDAFITKFSADGTGIDVSTFLGGSGSDNCSDIALQNRDIYINGYTTSRNFPTLYPFEGNYGGSSIQFASVAFVTKFHYIIPLPAAAPFGSFETPTDGATYAGSIAVTGWALDNGEIPSVKIYVDAGDGNGLIYVGEGLFVIGARPDIEQAFPEYPYYNTAGWGYMLLSHFLPGGGNGNYTIHAIASDSAGNEVTLGTKSIICDNANAVKPFGAIDTPLPGGSASGSSYRNAGWTLTPLPNTIPVDGSTITVYINGVPKGHPIYNIYRPDIASYFPGYNNTGGSLAYFDFDTTALANGVHTIAWGVSDDAGNADGIGSRFFSIQNSGLAQKAAKAGFSTLPAGSKILPLDLETVTVTKGYSSFNDWQDFYPGNNGVIDIEINPLERVVIDLNNGNGSNPGSSSHTGFLAVGDKRNPLPTGSTLNPADGLFYWQPGPGFSGSYDFVFIKKNRDGALSKKKITITIK